MSWRLHILVAVIIYSFSSQHTLAESRTETIRGELVAYDAWRRLVPCYHVCGGSVLLRIDEPRRKAARFVLVTFEYPDKEFPTELVTTSRVLIIEVVRDRRLDDTLDQYVPVVDATTGRASDTQVPIWRTVPGAETVELPFGERVEAYRFEGCLADLVNENGHE